MKNRNLFLSVLQLFLFIIGIVPGLLSQHSLFSYESYVGQQGDTLLYRQLISDYDTGSKYPLVIFLHGSGETGYDNEAQLKWGVRSFATSQTMKLYHPIVIAPQCPDKTAWADFSKTQKELRSAPTKPMRTLKKLIDDLISNLPVDTNRIYITGLSMGGSGVYDAIARYPGLFAAAVPVCGMGDPSLAPSFAHIPIWIFHGALDDVVSPDAAQDMFDALGKSGARPGFTMYPDIGHFSWIATYDDPKLMDWLFKQEK